MTPASSLRERASTPTGRMETSPALVEDHPSKLASIARTVSLCHSLAVAYGLDERTTRDQAAVASQSSGYSRRKQQEIAFTTCGSWIANQIVVGSLRPQRQVPRRQPGRRATTASRRPLRPQLPDRDGDDEADLDPVARTRRASYVDRYIDEWTIEGSPAMWRSRQWSKPPPPAIDPLRRQRPSPGPSPSPAGRGRR